MNKGILPMVAALVLSSCAGSGVKRVVIDESPNRPSWTDNQKLSFEEGDRIYFVSRQSVKGADRLAACYQIAANDGREYVIREIADNLKGQTNEVEGGISEDAEIFINKVRANDWNGHLVGFREEERYFQRVQYRDKETKSVTERQDCAVLSSISKADYEKNKSDILNEIIAIDPKVKTAIMDKQADFFKAREPTSEVSPKE